MTDLREARPGDWAAIRALLDGAGLPVEDLGADRLAGFLVAEQDATMVGLIGVEVFGTAGLLRSLVVAEAARKDGLGGRLVAALETSAQAAGIAELWLLTIDAERFFERHGFRVIWEGPPKHGRDAHPRVFMEKEFGCSKPTDPLE